MNEFIKSTKNGKLYISTKDFFKQEEIIRLVFKLNNSKLVNKINKLK